MSTRWHKDCFDDLYAGSQKRSIIIMTVPQSMPCSIFPLKSSVRIWVSSCHVCVFWNFHHTFLLCLFIHCKSLKNSHLIQTTHVSTFTEAWIKQLGWGRQFRSGRKTLNRNSVSVMLDFFAQFKGSHSGFFCHQDFNVSFLSVVTYLHNAYLELGHNIKK